MGLTLALCLVINVIKLLIITTDNLHSVDKVSTYTIKLCLTKVKFMRRHHFKVMFALATRDYVVFTKLAGLYYEGWAMFTQPVSFERNPL